MKGEDLDGYIAKYESLVIEAGYDQNNQLCIRKFTDRLPHKLYRDCMHLNCPENY